MWFKKIRSKEYLELFSLQEKLRIELEYLKLELQLYTKKLKASKGLAKQEETENFNNDNVLVPE